ncbi:MAG: transcription initiation factor IIB family protein [Candidatus Methanomethylicia archaeon]|nr:transcription initiation factor IIB family protein [Candidatus Methanomethylicia archaeon]MCX8169331.1 transcription initiation factor IIB family protein [Candidatus Methanomethylicia archaeon]MDW7988886.1 transcription initiation factor IIB family protein [Nitrososphaerota archaeon]
MSDTNTSSKCKECKGKLVVSEHGEIVCSECGLVHERTYLQPLFEIEPLSDFSAIEKVYVSPEGKPFRGRGLGSTFIKVKGKLIDGKGKEVKETRFYRLKKINFMYVKSKHRGIDALTTLRRVCSLLNIPKNVYERASYIYSKIINFDEYLGTTYQLTASSLILALRELQHPITLQDVIRTYREMGHKVSVKSVIRIMSKIRETMSIKNILRNPRDYLPRIINMLKSKEYINRKIFYFTGKSSEEYYTQLTLIANKTFNLIDERFRMGKNPYLLAVSIVYIADKIICKKLGCQPIISQKLAAEVLGSTEYTIRQHYKYLSNLLKNCEL